MKKIVNLYIFLFCIYYLQGTLYASGGIISRILLAVLMLISLYYFGYANINYKLPTPLKVLSIMVLAWTGYGMVIIMFGAGFGVRVPSYFYLKGIYLSLLPIYSFYTFARKGFLTDHLLKTWTFVFLAVCIFQFYREYNSLLLDAIGDIDEFTNNSGYIMVSLFVLLPLFQEKPLVQYSLLSVVLWYVLTGFKRGAILVGALCVIWMVYLSFTNKNERNQGRVGRKYLIRVLLTIVLIVVGVYTVNLLLSGSDYFNQRVEATLEGNSSNRDLIYGKMYGFIWQQNNIFNILFGNGADATLKIFGAYAHNDWLEIAVNNGLWMVVLYVVYWVSLAKFVLKGNKYSVCSQMLTLFFFIYFLKTLFSMSYNDITPYAACAFGYALANFKDSSSTS